MGELRKKCGLTQDELGKLMGVDRTQVSAIERGVRYPSYEHLQRLANCFDVAVDYLMGRSDLPNIITQDIIDIEKQLKNAEVIYRSRILTEDEKKKILAFIELILD